MGTANAKLIQEHQQLLKIYGLEHPLTKKLGRDIDLSQERCRHPEPVKRIAQVDMKAINVEQGESFSLCLLCSKGMALEKSRR